jgi:xanthine dehydrogenase accessory factor
MTEVLEAVQRWLAEGRRVALATVVGVERSAPRDPGAVLAVSEDGQVAGSVSGGCVESAVYEEAQDAISTGRPRIVSYGISDADAISVGLTCGGTIHVFVEPLDGWSQWGKDGASVFERLSAAIRSEGPVALATRLGDTHLGAKLLISADAVAGDLGSAGLNEAAALEARALLALGETETRTFGGDGEPIGVEARVFIQSFAPKPNMYIFGAIDFSRAMARLGKYLGYRVTVVDARPVFATKMRIPDADDVIVEWPDAFLARAPVDESTALIVLTHDVKFDIPLLLAALQTNAGYIGAMGSRRTHANRVAELREAGISERDLARISAPVGLDLGARTPEETAVSIAAEIIALRSGRSGGRLSDGSAPIHASRQPVVAP